MNEGQITEAILGLKEAVAEIRSDVKSAFRRIDEQKSMMESVHSLAISVGEIAAEMKQITVRQDSLDKKQDRLFNDLEELKMRPVDNWQTIVKTALGGIVGALIGAAMLLLLK